MADLYDRRIDAMMARECDEPDAWVRSVGAAYVNWLVQKPRNTDRLAAYKRKRRDFFGAILSHAIFTNGGIVENTSRKFTHD